MKRKFMIDEIFVTVFVVFFILALGFVVYLGFSFIDKVEAKKDWCAEAGGISLISDRGHFKVCLDPNAVIKSPDK